RSETRIARATERSTPDLVRARPLPVLCVGLGCTDTPGDLCQKRSRSSGSLEAEEDSIREARTRRHMSDLSNAREKRIGGHRRRLNQRLERRDDVEIEAAPVSGRAGLEPAEHRLRHVLDGQICHAALLLYPKWFHNGTISR